MFDKILLVNTPPHNLSDIIKSKRSRSVGQKGRQIFPSGLLSIGAFLESKGFEICYKDMWNMKWSQIKEFLVKENPDIIFSSCLTDNRQSSFTLARISKKLNPNIVNVIGNAHATAMYEQVLTNYPEIDYVVLGEGEITCYELIKCLREGGNIGDVKGIAYQYNGICTTEKRPLIKNLDELPYPTKYRFNPDNHTDVTINTSRGCPYNCSYCSLSGYWGSVWRGKSAKEVLKEIEFLVSNGAKHITFTDDHFTFNKKRVMEICEGFKKYNFTWAMQCRVDRIDRDMLELFKETRCKLIVFGIETMSPTILKNIHKMFTVEQIKTTFKMAHEIGVPVQANIMIGAMGENQGTINETIEGLKEIKPDFVAKFITMVYPNTPLYQEMKNNGSISDNFWLLSNPAPFYIFENDIATLRKYSLQVQIAWYKQQGIIRSVKEVYGLIKEHGFMFAISYVLDGLSKISILKFMDVKKKNKKIK